MQNVIEEKVRLDFAYPCVFTEDVFDPRNRALADVIAAGQSGRTASKVLAVLDQGVVAANPEVLERLSAYMPCLAPSVQMAGEPLVVPGGEAVKNDERYVRQILALVHRCGLDRHSYIFAIGGGAVLDMVGYAAAICHRGIRLVRFPTTVLAQNDSGIGVKNGINAFGKKNFLGTFAPPFAVINDVCFLPTLADRDWRAGISEAVKVALLKDAQFFTFLEESAGTLRARDLESMQMLIRRCAKLHLDHIATSGDPFEGGSSRPLDFGHWAAHKLEQISGFRIRHGEAVAIGIALDSIYSMLDGRLDSADMGRILRLFSDLGFSLYEPELGLRDAGGRLVLLAGLEEFREHLGGELTVMLLAGIGKGVEAHEMDTGRILRSLEILQEWAN
jgi:3-dehydroquinate synthase